MNNKYRYLVVLAVGILVSSALLPAQTTQTGGSISGVVRDSSGAVVPGAEVVITNQDTGVKRDLVTDASGSYTAPNVPVGIYSVTVSSASFKTATARDIKVDIRSNRIVDFKLEIGQMSQEVTVEGAPLSQVELRSGEVGKLIEGKQVTELPLNGRSFVQLALLVPGASVRQGATIRDRQDNIGISFSGGMSLSNMWLVDGTNNVNLLTGGTLNVIPSVDSISEFKIQYNSYGAEMSSSGGAQVNVVTKSGTNRLHGTLYEFHRNSALNATNFFLNRAGKKKQPLTYNNFGYTAGGPILKDKAFFFWSQEFRRDYRGIVRQAAVPTNAERTGDFSGALSGGYPAPKDPLTGNPFPGNKIPSDRLSPGGLAVMKLYPSPNAAGFLNWVEAPKTPITTRQETIRGDYVINKRNSVMARYTHDSWINRVPQSGASWADDPFPAVDSNITYPGKSLTTEWTLTLGPSALNQFSFNWSGNSNDLKRGAGEEINQAINKTIPEVFPGPEDHGHATFWADPYGNVLIHASPMVANVDLKIWKDDFSKVAGNHSYKAGFGISRNTSLSDIDASGSADAPSFILPVPGKKGVNPGPGPAGALGNGNIVSGNGVADQILKDVYYSGFEFSGNVSPDIRWKDYEAYFSDTWRMHPRFTLTYGLRWSFFPHPYDEKDQIGNFVASLYNPAEGQVSSNAMIFPHNIRGLDVDERSLVKNHLNNFGPRLGFAFDPTGKGKWSIRGGGGVFFNREYLYDIALLALNPPFQKRIDWNFGRPFDYLPTDDTYAGSTGTARNGKVIKGDTPGSYQWNLTIEREMWKDTKVEVSYVGNRGHHLPGTYDANLVPPSLRKQYAILLFSGQNPHVLRPFYALKGASTEPRVYGRGLDSSYHALQVYMVKRFSKNLSYQTAYTFSKLLSTANSFGHLSSIRVSDPSNIKYDKGLVDFDRTHIFTGNLIYRTPALSGMNPLIRGVVGDWETAAIYTGNSGRAESIYMSTAFTGTFFNRPDLVANPEGPKTIDQWFNSAAFAPNPVLGQLGNSPKGVYRGPGINNWDLSIMKNFPGIYWPMKERATFQFRAEFFNAFNHTQPQFVNSSFPVTNIKVDLTTGLLTSYRISNPNFGRVTSVREPREIQFGLKIIW